MHKKMKYEEIQKIKKGDILHNSWGYDMTINDFCRVEENTGKTIKCQKLAKKRVGDSTDAMVYSVMPNESRPVCKPFRLRIAKSKPNINDPEGEDGWITGSYPYATNGPTPNCQNKHKGFWDKWNGLPMGENHAD